MYVKGFMLLHVYLCSLVFVSSLSSSINFMRWNFWPDYCFSGLVRVSRAGCGRRIELWWYQLALVSVAYVLMIASHHLVISGVNCPWCLWVDLVHPVSLWAWLWCRSWESRCLWVWESVCSMALPQAELWAGKICLWQGRVDMVYLCSALWES